MADCSAATAASRLAVHPTFTRVYFRRPVAAEPMEARCLPDSSSWDDWRRDIGLPDSELRIGADSIIDPDSAGPRIWFHVLPDA